MSALSDAYGGFVARLREQLEDTPLRVLDIATSDVERRNVVVGPPTFAWEGMCDPTQPSSMTVQVLLIEDVGERAIERLLDELPALLEAIDSPDATVTGAEPAAYPSGTRDLPAYQITVETTL